MATELHPTITNATEEPWTSGVAWGRLWGAFGPSDGSRCAGANVPSALGVLRLVELYRDAPAEIVDAFWVLENHVMYGEKLYPVAIETIPFLFDLLRWQSPHSVRIAELIVRYSMLADSLEWPLERLAMAVISEHAAKSFGHHRRFAG
jgi:hypothetical protein